MTFTWTRTVSPICTLGVSLPSASLFSSLAGDEAEREAVTQAVRFGLAALDHRDLG